MIIFSVLFILLISGCALRLGFNRVTENIFIVIIFKFILEFVYKVYYLDEDVFNNNIIKWYITEIIVVFIINQEFINKVDDVFLSGNDLKIIIWLLLGFCVYKYLKDDNVKEHSFEKRSISLEKVYVSYAKFKLNYGEEIEVKDSSLRLIVYSIMIYSDFNRPKFLRRLDNFIFKITLKPRKLGIMQVTSKKFITDYDSILLVCKKIDKLSVKCKTSKKDNYKEIFKMYDKDNCEMLNYIYEGLNKFCNL